MRPYSEFCGPTALAAIAGIPRASAARVLLAVADRLGEAADPGTSPRLLATALVRYRLAGERWSVAKHGWRIGLALDGIRAEAAAEAELRAMVIPPSAPSPPMSDDVRAFIAQVAAVAAERRARRVEPLHTVDSWAARFPRGRWVLHCCTHWVALVDGTLTGAVTGETAHGEHKLLDAWRIVPRVRQ